MVRHSGVLHIRQQTILAIAGALFNLFVACASVRAEQFPVRVYTTADGLVNDRVSRIVADPKGYLWFCTEGGLSRFDGYSFTNYTTAQGLPDNWVNDLLITRDGQYWIATEGGLCSFSPDSRAQPVRAIYRPTEDRVGSRITNLLEDHAGNLWCGTWQGLYRVERDNQIAFHLVTLGLASPKDELVHVRSLIADRGSNIWVASDSGLHRITADGQGETYTTRNGLPVINMMGIVEDREGRIWAGTRGGGLCLIAAEPRANKNVVALQYTNRNGLRCNSIGAMLLSSSGRFWIGTECGLNEILSDKVKSLESAAVISDTKIWSLAEDSRGNLWIGSPAGAVKVRLTGVTTYTQANGLGGNDIYAISETPNGEVVVSSSSSRGDMLSVFDGNRFVAVRPNISGQSNESSWRANHGAMIDHTGDWWIPTRNGLYRFPKSSQAVDLARLRPKAIYNSRNGLPDDFIVKLYEDSQGDVWIATFSHPGILVRWERKTEKLHRYTEQHGLPMDQEGPHDFCEDREGNLWVGFRGGAIARFRQGRFHLFTTADGIPEGSIHDLFVDQAGRLWIASNQGGLGRTDDPTKDQPHFTVMTEADGLSSNQIRCIVDDEQGRIYVGTVRGLDRIDEGRIRHYTTADGLANQAIETAFRDHHGALWLATSTGLSRLAPERETAKVQPDVLISNLIVSGKEQSLRGLGERSISGLEFGSTQNNLQIEFFGFDFGGQLKYQYRLENVDSDWSTPASNRSVNYASLQPGSYRFLVQALNADGLASQTPASIAFVILRPFWQRWWFVTPVVVCITLLVYGAYRYRVAQLIRIERVRTRIATDLHDDIGSNLSVIAGMSNLLRQQMKDADASVTDRLGMIASVSSRSVEAMSDIIWAINPGKDNTADLAQRMRRFAGDAFTSRDIEFTFIAPGAEHNAKIDTETRREAFLIFKEAVNNAVRHSGCSRAEVVIEIDSGRLVLKVTDNGKGFDLESAEYGNGVMSMRQRAKRLGGSLVIESKAGQGTTTILNAPLQY